MWEEGSPRQHRERGRGVICGTIVAELRVQWQHVDRPARRQAEGQVRVGDRREGHVHQLGRGHADRPRQQRLCHFGSWYGRSVVRGEVWQDQRRHPPGVQFSVHSRIRLRQIHVRGDAGAGPTPTSKGVQGRVEALLDERGLLHGLDVPRQQIQVLQKVVTNPALQAHTL